MKYIKGPYFYGQNDSQKEISNGEEQQWQIGLDENGFGCRKDSSDYMSVSGYIDEGTARLFTASEDLYNAVIRVLSSRHFSIDFEHNRSPEAIDIRNILELAAKKAEGR